MEDLVPIFSVFSVFGSVVLIVSISTNFSLKKRLIEKNLVGEEAMSFFRSVDNKLNALKWGLIILFGGIGLVIIDACRLDGDDAMTYGIEAISVAIGFILYFFIAKRENSN